jgi:hypothetical protein
MHILYSPQAIANNNLISYQFGTDSIIAEYKNISDMFDFSQMPDGEIYLYDSEARPLFETALEFMPISRAYRENGALHVELIKFYKEETADGNDKNPKEFDV